VRDPPTLCYANVCLTLFSSSPPLSYSSLRSGLIFDIGGPLGSTRSVSLKFVAPQFLFSFVQTAFFAMLLGLFFWCHAPPTLSWLSLDVYLHASPPAITFSIFALCVVRVLFRDSACGVDNDLLPPGPVFLQPVPPFYDHCSPVRLLKFSLFVLDKLCSSVCKLLSPTYSSSCPPPLL